MLRMKEDVFARKAMTLYFDGKDVKARHGNFCFSASVLSDDCKKSFNMGSKTKSDYETMATVAKDRINWTAVFAAKVADVVFELRAASITMRREARNAKTPYKENRKLVHSGLFV